jgi:hypothetical protein
VKRHPRAYWERLVAEVDAGAAAASVARKHGASPADPPAARSVRRRAPPAATLAALAASEGARDAADAGSVGDERHERQRQRWRSRSEGATRIAAS